MSQDLCAPLRDDAQRLSLALPESYALMHLRHKLREQEKRGPESSRLFAATTLRILHEGFQSAAAQLLKPRMDDNRVALENLLQTAAAKPVQSLPHPGRTTSRTRLRHNKSASSSVKSLRVPPTREPT